MASDYTRADHTHMLRVYNCDLWEKYWDGAATPPRWTGWINRSGAVGETMCFNGAAAISVSDGQTHIVGSTSGTLWHKWRTGSGSYNGFTYLHYPPGNEYIDGPIAIANSGSPGPGQIHIVGISKAPGLSYGTVYLKMYRGTWEPWQNLGGADTIGGSLAVANRGGLIHVAGLRPSDATVWMTWWNGDFPWQGWEPQGGMFAGALAIDNTNAVPLNTAGTAHVGVHIIALNSGYVMLRCWDTEPPDGYCLDGWWQSQGGTGGYVGPLSITNTFGEVHMVARNSGTLLHHRERNP